LSVQEIAMLAQQTYPAIAPESRALRWDLVWAAIILAAIAALLLVASHPSPSIREKHDSSEDLLSSLKVDAYRQHKPLGSAFATPQQRPVVVSVTAHDSPQLRQVP
jgi:hypothetical protein